MNETVTQPDITKFPMPRPDPLSQPRAYESLRAGPPRRLDWMYGDAPWLITRHSDVRTVLASPAMSSDSNNPDLPRLTPLPPGPSRMSFIRMDAPEHGRLRRTLTAEFTARKVQSLLPVVQSTADQLLDDLAAQAPPVDLCTAFALPLATTVICTLLGVPYEDREFFYAHSETISDGKASPEAVGNAFMQLSGYLDRLTSAKEKEPADDILSRVATAHVATGELTHDELAAMARLILFAGHEISARMISLSVLTLLSNPDQLARLRAQPDLIRSTVEEMLRYLSVLQGGLARVATEDVMVGEQLIRAGEGVVCLIAAANHDESVFAAAGKVDITRHPQQHVAFGYGAHQCLGRALAMAELEVGLGGLIRRLPGLRLAVEPRELTFLHDSLTYGVAELPVAW